MSTRIGDFSRHIYRRFERTSNKQSLGKMAFLAYLYLTETVHEGTRKRPFREGQYDLRRRYAQLFDAPGFDRTAPSTDP